MKIPEPIYPEEIEKIKADYEKKISENPAMKDIYMVMCETDVANAIGRQRNEALAKGGELAKRIEEENAEMMHEAEELKSQISKFSLQEAEKEIAKIKEKLEDVKAYAENIKAENANVGKFCEYCGSMLKDNAKFCTECGAPVK